MERTLRDAILARDRFTCQSCGKRTRGYVYHVLPRGRAGYESPNNLITLCGRCQMLASPMPLKVLKRVLKAGEPETITERARVKGAIQAWMLSKGQNEASLNTNNRKPVPTVIVRQDHAVAEWKKGRPRAGKTWSSEEDHKLLADYSAGAPVEAIANRLGRGVFSVQVRLCKLGWAVD